MSSEELPPLDYESPAMRSHGSGYGDERREAAGCFGVGALVLGVPLVVGGLVRIVVNAWESFRFLRADEPATIACLLGMGGVLVAAGIRWGLVWRRGRRSSGL